MPWRGGGSGLHLSFFSSVIVDVCVGDEGNNAVDVTVVVSDNGVTWMSFRSTRELNIEREVRMPAKFWSTSVSKVKLNLSELFRNFDVDLCTLMWNLRIKLKKIKTGSLPAFTTFSDCFWGEGSKQTRKKIFTNKRRWFSTHMNNHKIYRVLFLTVPPDFQYQNVYVEENPPSPFDSTLTVNYRLITCQPSPPNHNNYDILTIMIISTTNEIWCWIKPHS